MVYTSATSEANDDSVQDWIDGAMRAHNLVERANLDPVAAHDPSEVSKLDKVIDALGDLSQSNNVEYVPGVDEDDAPTLDENHIPRSELMQLLDNPGMAERLGRVYRSKRDDPIRQLDSIPHNEGLPEYNACIAPDHTPADGATAYSSPSP